MTRRSTMRPVRPIPVVSHGTVWGYAMMDYSGSAPDYISAVWDSYDRLDREATFRPYGGAWANVRDYVWVQGYEPSHEPSWPPEHVPPAHIVTSAHREVDA